MKKILFSITTLCLGTFLNAQSLHFSHHADLNSHYASASTPVDVNNDGFVDVVTTGAVGYFDYKFFVYLNDGQGNLSVSPQEVVLPGLLYAAIASGDIDGDGDADLFVTGRNSSSTKISKLLINDGTGQFTISNKSFTGLDGGDVEIFDFNGDGKLDIFICGKNSNNLSETVLYRQVTYGNFTAMDISQSGLDSYDNGSSIAYGDVNSDGRPDVIMAGRMNNGSPSFNLYLNNGSNFTRQTSVTLTGMTECDVQLGDVNGDGKLDIIGRSSINKINVYVQANSNTFNSHFITIAAQEGNGKIELRDLNFDGKDDIISYSDAGVFVYYGNSNMTTPGGVVNLLIPAYARGTMSVADFNYDGLLDIYVDGSNTNSDSPAKMYLNNSCPSNITDGLPTANTDGVLATTISEIPFATYQWFECSNLDVPLSTSFSFTPTVSGEYTVEVTLLNACSGSSDCLAVVIAPVDDNDDDNDDDDDDNNGPGVGVTPIESANALIFPNPSQSGLFNVEAEGIESVEVIDINGKIIVSTTGLNTASVVVDLQFQDAGVYFMTITTAKAKIVERLMK